MTRERMCEVFAEIGEERDAGAIEGVSDETLARELIQAIVGDLESCSGPKNDSQLHEYLFEITNEPFGSPHDKSGDPVAA